MLPHDATQAEDAISLCRGADEKTSALLETRIPADFANDVGTVRALVEKLRNELDLSFSFIEDRPEEPITLPTAERNLEEVLRAIVQHHDRYRCEVYDGRLVLRSVNSIFDVVISGVDIVDAYRFPARDDYIDHLNDDPRFKDWFSLWSVGGLGGSPVFDGQVTLSPRAPVVQHFAQLLGRNRVVYFSVLAWDSRPPTNPWVHIRFDAVKEPWQRNLVNARRYWAERARELQ